MAMTSYCCIRLLVLIGIIGIIGMMIDDKGNDASDPDLIYPCVNLHSSNSCIN
jgi:hypothetical protein